MSQEDEESVCERIERDREREAEGQKGPSSFKLKVGSHDAASVMAQQSQQQQSALLQTQASLGAWCQLGRWDLGQQELSTGLLCS